MRKRLLVGLVVALSFRTSTARAQQRTALPVTQTILAGKGLRPSFHASFAQASRRLESPACQLVLRDFRDTEGHLLADNLEAMGVTAPEYLGRVYFMGGGGVARCQSSRILATTSPGSRVVFVCDSFYKVDRAESPYLAYTLIHEMLHSLGLGENPPTPSEITSRIAERCGS